MTKQEKGNVAKGVMVGAAVLAGVATVMALKDKKTRKKVEKSLTSMKAKGMELKKKAEKWAKDHPSQKAVVDKFLEKPPVKKMSRAMAG